MTPTDIVVWVGGIATIICAIYTVLGYYRPAGAAVSANVIDSTTVPQRRPWIPIICVGLVWLAVGFDYFTRPPVPDATIVNYGLDGPTQFHAVAQINSWRKLEGQKAILVTRTVFGDRDRLTDDWIAKSIAYTIDGPVIYMITITNNQMHFAPGLLNMIEYTLIVLPADKSPEQIRILGDVAGLGGRILAVAGQGIPVAAQPTVAKPN